MVRLVLSLAVSHGWALHQLEVNNAFLQGTLLENVFMTQPSGFIDHDNPNHVCQLQKAIYGLNQAPRAWYHELRSYLLSFEFINSIADASLFVFRGHSTVIYLLVYVNDIIVTGNTSSTISQFLQHLSDRFSLKDLSHLHYFLGVKVIPYVDGLFLSQRKYIVDLLSKAQITEAKPVSTPMSSSVSLTLHSGSPLADTVAYRTIVGSLQYLSLTRPNISYTVNKLSQFMHQPTTNHWTAAGDKDGFTSTSDYFIYLGRNPVSWSSKKQKTIAWSSTEAEYRFVANTAVELRWLCSLLSELDVIIAQQPVIYCENVGATHLCANLVFHSRMKHVALDYHFINEQVQSGRLRVSHISTTDQLVDALTKPLPR
ncbi:hypothetical protein CXB51_017422 [Gossypium anomalum]|uniref:Reverse transcriptase Ty1/copia-type domain-containing protein n=1 Tax=Gossypium anomalum TaxID=47600 RepID=A0A8J6D0U2_9ROSI|nr:hypothetical protein CXB51_017422 [Gossypium anomalum]